MAVGKEEALVTVVVLGEEVVAERDMVSVLDQEVPEVPEGEEGEEAVGLVEYILYQEEGVLAVVAVVALGLVTDQHWARIHNLYQL